MSEIEQAEYIAQLNPMELRVLQIAKIQLQTSFSLVKSIGFINWMKKQKALLLLVQAIAPITAEPEVPIEIIIQAPEQAPELVALEPTLVKTIIKKRLKIVPAKAKL
jgi:hypothetical protein